MGRKKKKRGVTLPKKVEKWAGIRARFKLSDAHIQMVRELSMSCADVCTYVKRRVKRRMPRLEKFIESRYRNQFGVLRLQEVLGNAVSVEEQWEEKKVERKIRREIARGHPKPKNRASAS